MLFPDMLTTLQNELMNSREMQIKIFAAAIILELFTNNSTDNSKMLNITNWMMEFLHVYNVDRTQKEESSKDVKVLMVNVAKMLVQNLEHYEVIFNNYNCYCNYNRRTEEHSCLPKEAQSFINTAYVTLANAANSNHDFKTSIECHEKCIARSKRINLPYAIHILFLTEAQRMTNIQPQKLMENYSWFLETFIKEKKPVNNFDLQLFMDVYVSGSKSKHTQKLHKRNKCIREVKKLFDQNNFEEAKEVCHDGWKAYKHLIDKASSTFLSGISRCHDRMGDYKSAAIFINKAMNELNTSDPSPDETNAMASFKATAGFIKMNVGEFYNAQGYFEEAYNMIVLSRRPLSDVDRIIEYRYV
jgi:tetratricopeptide (TPR) repeat protein